MLVLCVLLFVYGYTHYDVFRIYYCRVCYCELFCRCVCVVLLDMMCVLCCVFVCVLLCHMLCSYCCLSYIVLCVVYLSYSVLCVIIVIRHSLFVIMCWLVRAVVGWFLLFVCVLFVLCVGVV